MMGWFSAVIERRTARAWMLGTILLSVILATAAASVVTGVASAAACATVSVLPGSAFEIDLGSDGANLKVDGAAADCKDWENVSDTPKADLASGKTDDAFGQGTAEDNPNPTIVLGSIPPNKSDLTRFSTNTELGTSGKFLELYWVRQNVPSGTTNMDFELNKLFCDPSKTPSNCADNGSKETATPQRSQGDKLITYDLENGGTKPTISIRTWNGTSWSAPTCLSAPAGVTCSGDSLHQALGSVNQTAISSSEIPTNGGNLDAFTFGEAAISYAALFSGNTCGSFGSAYLKSRSSSSFSAELKDFVKPVPVTISNCASISTKLSSESIAPGDSVHDSATLTGATNDAGGTVKYTVYTDDKCTSFYADAGTKTVTNGVVPDSDPVTFNAVGTFYWQASYSGDGNNSTATSTCTSEKLVVAKSPTTIKTDQNWLPNDAATVNSADGTAVTFSLHKNGPAADPCSNTAEFSENTNASGGGASTSNTNYKVTTVTSGDYYYWKVEVAADATHDAATSCNEATTFTSLDNDTTT